MALALDDSDGVWKDIVGPLLEKVPRGYLFAAFCVFILGWVLRSTLPALAEVWKKDRENQRKHNMAIKKLNADIDERRKGA